MSHVNVLQDMKKQLEELKIATESNIPVDSVSQSSNRNLGIDKEKEIQNLEQLIQQKVK